MQARENTLALDAAFGQASACLLHSDGRSFHATGEEALPHSQGILPLLEGLLRQANLDWKELQMLAVGIGPGSFTGLRVAAASMAGINAVLKLPVLTLSSLAITALQTDSKDIWVCEDARSGDAYVGHYMAGKAVKPDSCLPWDRVSDLSIDRYTGQSGKIVSEKEPVGRYQPLIRPRPQALEDLVIMMREDSESIESTVFYPTPTYIRPSQAERNASHS